MAEGAFIYQVTHSASGRCYVGVTRCSLARRWAGHRANARNNSQTHFHRALRKYGAEAFSWRGLAWVSTFERALRLEQALIAELRPAFNMTNGGEGTQGYRLPQESRKAASQKTAAKLRGVPKSPEHCAIISELAQSRAQTLQGRLHLANNGRLTAAKKAAQGLPQVALTAAAREKMSAAAKARCTPEWRESVSKRQTGKVASPETRAKLVAAHTKYPPGFACTECGAVDRKIAGRGKCKTCFQREHARLRRARKQAA